MVNSAVNSEQTDFNSDARLDHGSAKVPRNLRLLVNLLRQPAPVEQEETLPEVNTPGALPMEFHAEQAAKSKFKLRHAIIAASFVGIVVLPASVTSGYMAFWAADQYHSTSSFSVRSIEASAPSDLLGMFSQSSAGTTISDSFVLLDFVLSERMVQAVDEAFGMENVFAPDRSDFYFRLRKDAPIEEKVSYWRRMISIDLDHTSGIMNLTVKSFDPALSQKLSEFIIAQSEKLVNELSITGRNEVLKTAESEVTKNEGRLSQARAALRDYRDASQEADPVEGAKLVTQLVASLEQQLVQLKTELSTALMQLGEDTPRVRVLRSQVLSLETQLQREKQRFGTGFSGKQGRSASVGSDVAGRIQQYEVLQTQNEFAERAYGSALASLEKARIEAGSKQRYLAVFLKPTMSEMAQYPRRLLSTVLVTLGALLLWGVGVMGYYNIRDRN